MKVHFRLLLKLIQLFREILWKRALDTDHYCLIEGLIISIQVLKCRQFFWHSLLMNYSVCYLGLSLHNSVERPPRMWVTTISKSWYVLYCYYFLGTILRSEFSVKRGKVRLSKNWAKSVDKQNASFFRSQQFLFYTTLFYHLPKVEYLPIQKYTFWIILVENY